jgi:[ribosomal protein S18]-alanine N-acetyltransferase
MGLVPRDPVHLRAARHEDAPSLAAFEELVFADEPNRISPRQWRYLVARGDDATVVAEAGGELLGVLVLSFRTGGRGLRIYSLGVHPRARRRGVARVLLEYAVRYAELNRLEVMRLEVRADNRAAIALYRAFGFLPVAKLANYYGLGEDGLRMERPAPV